PLDVAALLDQFEHLIDAMVEIAGARGSSGGARPAPQGDGVPTVSGVVFGLGPEREAPDPSAIADMPHPTDIAVGGAPTVAMLKAMVETLNASVPVSAADAPAAAAGDPVSV